VVVFDENHIIQPEAMIIAAADGNSPFFKNPKAGSCLSCVENLSRSAFNELYKAAGFCCNAAHALHKIQQQAFGFQDVPQVAFYLNQFLPGLCFVSVFDKCSYLKRLVNTAQNLQGNGYACYYAFFLARTIALPVAFSAMQAREVWSP